LKIGRGSSVRKLAAAAIAGLFLSAADARLPTAPWTPVGDWAVHKRHICSAYKRFQNGKNVILVSIKPSITTGSLRIAFEVPSDIHAYGLTLASGKIGKRRLDFDTMAVSPSTNKGRLIYSLWAGQEDIAGLAAGEQLSFNTRSLGLKLAIPDARAALAKLEPCNAEVLEDWGLSLEDQAAVASFPVQTSREKTRYPKLAARAAALGDVEGRVTVGTDGIARNCVILLSSGHRELDQTSCAAMTSGARFTPARRRDGTAMESPYFFTARYRL
jgi:TonB family protein